MNNNKVKILHIDNSSDVTGASRSLVQFCMDHSQQYESVFIVPDKTKAYQSLPAEFKVYELKLIEVSKNPRNLILYFPYLLINIFRTVKIISIEKPDVLHSNDLYNLIFPLIKLFRLSGKPLWTHIRLLPDAYNKLMYKPYVYLSGKNSQIITVVSHFLKNKFKPDQKMFVVYDYTKVVERYEPYQISDRLSVRIFVLANYTQGKGHEYVVEALKNLNSKGVDFQVTFAGSDLGLAKNKLYKIELMNLIKEYGLNEKVTFKDRIDEVEREMKEHDLQIVYSDSESFSMVAYEALYYRIPLIVSDCGGPSDFSVHDKSCYTVPRKNPAALSQAIEYMINSVDKRKMFSEQSREVQAEMIEQGNENNELVAFLAQTKELKQ